MSYGGLTKPTQQVSEWVKSLEEIFLSTHGDVFINRFNILRKLIETMKEKCPGVPDEVITLFARSRIYMRCKYLNKKRLEEALLKRKETKEIEFLNVKVACLKT